VRAGERVGGRVARKCQPEGRHAAQAHRGRGRVEHGEDSRESGLPTHRQADLLLQLPAEVPCQQVLGAGCPCRRGEGGHLKNIKNWEIPLLGP